MSHHEQWDKKHSRCVLEDYQTYILLLNFSIRHAKCRKVAQSVRNELQRMWREVVEAHMDVFSWHLLVGSEETDERLQDLVRLPMKIRIEVLNVCQQRDVTMQDSVKVNKDIMLRIQIL